MHIFLLFALMILPVMASDDFSYEDYEEVSYIPEPMIFDLVRPLSSKKGQWEVNALILQEDSPELSHSHQSPEIEYVLWDDIALELEIPSIGGEPDALKGVLQWTIGHSGKNNHSVHGVQLIHMHNIKEGTFDETTPVYIFGNRLSKDMSYLLMLGDQYRNGDHTNEHRLVLNATVFHVYSQVKELEFGLEQNILGFGRNFDYWRITPQLEVVLEHHMKLQMGFGVLYSYAKGWESTSSFRFIKEFY
jgi:hypothetical protein